MRQEALDNSVPIGSNTTRRVGISDEEIVVFDETSDGIFHGHPAVKRSSFTTGKCYNRESERTRFKKYLRGSVAFSC